MSDKYILEHPKGIDIDFDSTGKTITRPLTVTGNDQILNISENPAIKLSCCNKKLDIVICVECGASYHRNCFAKKGGSLNENSANVLCCSNQTLQIGNIIRGKSEMMNLNPKTVSAEEKNHSSVVIEATKYTKLIEENKQLKDQLVDLKLQRLENENKLLNRIIQEIDKGNTLMEVNNSVPNLKSQSTQTDRPSVNITHSFKIPSQNNKPGKVLFQQVFPTAVLQPIEISNQNPNDDNYTNKTIMKVDNNRILQEDMEFENTENNVYITKDTISDESFANKIDQILHLVTGLSKSNPNRKMIHADINSSAQILTKKEDIFKNNHFIKNECNEGEVLIDDSLHSSKNNNACSCGNFENRASASENNNFVNPSTESEGINQQYVTLCQSSKIKILKVNNEDEIMSQCKNQEGAKLTKKYREGAEYLENETLNLDSCKSNHILQFLKDILNDVSTFLNKLSSTIDNNANDVIKNATFDHSTLSDSINERETDAINMEYEESENANTLIDQDIDSKYKQISAEVGIYKEVNKKIKNKSSDDQASTPASDKEVQILVEGLKDGRIYLVHRKSPTFKITKIEDVIKSKVRPDESKPIGNEKTDKKLISSSELKTKIKLNNSKDVEIINNDEVKKTSPAERRNKLNPTLKIPEHSKSKHRSEIKTKLAKRYKSYEISNPLIKSDDITENEKSEEINQSKSVPQEKKIEETKQSVQIRRKSILERKIEQLKHKNSQQIKANSDEFIKNPSEVKLNSEISSKYSELDMAKISEALKKSTHIRKTSEPIKKKPLEGKNTSNVVGSSKKSEEIDVKPTDKMYYPIDTSLGEHLEFDIHFDDDFIQYTYNEDEEHRIITWNKNFLLKKRSVDIVIDALEKNITRPIVVESNDNIFFYQPPHKRRTSFYIAEDVKIQPKKKPLRALYNGLVRNEKHISLLTKSPLDELYSNENNQIKITEQFQNDNIQSNKVGCVVKRTNMDEVKNVETIQKDVVIKESEACTTKIDFFKQSTYNTVPSTLDQSEYDSLMDFSLVLSGTKRKAVSEQEKGARKNKPDKHKKKPKNYNIDKFLSLNF